MNKIRSKRVRTPLIIGLCMCLLGPAEEAASLTGEVLTLEAVLAYAREHNPAIRVAKSRLLAAQKVPAQASAYDDPTSIMGSLECS